MMSVSDFAAGRASGTGSAGNAILATASRSCAARRPQANASLFMRTATALSSIAFSIDSSWSGMRPFWNAKPSMNMLPAIASPMRAVAMRVASTTYMPSGPTASEIEACSAAFGNLMSRFWMNAAVICS